MPVVIASFEVIVAESTGDDKAPRVQERMIWAGGTKALGLIRAVVETVKTGNSTYLCDPNKPQFKFEKKPSGKIQVLKRKRGRLEDATLADLPAHALWGLQELFPDTITEMFE